jgi:DNA-binding transcriptional LysR family regulator
MLARPAPADGVPPAIMTAPLKLSQLRHLVTVVECGTVRQAAKVLFLSQSSVTKSIQQLEEAVGVPLLHRTVHGVEPTLAGRALIARARTIENELREARNDIDTILGAGSGEVRIAASPTVATSILPRAVLEFRRSRPRVSLELHEGVFPDVLKAVRTGEVDLAICLVPEWVEDETVAFEILLRDTVAPAVRIDHRLARHRMKLAEIVSADWVVYRRGRTGRDIFEQTFVAAGLEPPAGMIECSSFTCVLALVERGDYVTFLPRQLLSDPAVRRSIAPIDMHTPMPSWNVAVIYRAQHELSAVCRAFLESLESVSRQIVASGDIRR